MPLSRWSEVAAIVGLVLAVTAPRAALAAHVVLRWQSVVDASAYELEIAKDPSFADVVLRAVVAGGSFRWAALPAVTHFWRVRSIDADGRRGQWSRSMKIAAVLLPPELLSPGDDARFTFGEHAPNIELEYGGAKLATAFRVEVAGEPSFAHALPVEPAGLHRVSFRPPKIGPYFWRVTSLDINGRASLPSAARRFAVELARPVLFYPADNASIAAGESTGFSWSPRPAAHRLVVEVAAEGSFTSIVMRERVYGGRAHLAMQRAGAYFWRLCALNDGRALCSGARSLHVRAATVSKVDREPAATADSQSTNATGAPSPATLAGQLPPIRNDREATTPSPSGRQRWRVGAGAGLLTNLAAFVAPQLELELSFWPRAWRQSGGVGLRASYLQQQLVARDRDAKARSHLHGFGADLLVEGALGDGHTRFVAGGGLHVGLSVVSVSVPTHPTFYVVHGAPGLAAQASLEHSFKSGTAALRVMGVLSPGDAGAVRSNLSGLSFVFAYSWWLP